MATITIHPDGKLITLDNKKYLLQENETAMAKNLKNVVSDIDQNFKDLQPKVTCEGGRLITSYNADLLIRAMKDIDQPFFMNDWGEDIKEKRKIFVPDSAIEVIRTRILNHNPEILNAVFGMDGIYKKEELIFVRNDEDDIWELRYFCKFKDGTARCFQHQRTYGDTWPYRFHAKAEGVKLPDSKQTKQTRNRRKK